MTCAADTTIGTKLLSSEPAHSELARAYSRPGCNFVERAVGPPPDGR